MSPPNAWQTNDDYEVVRKNERDMMSYNEADFQSASKPIRAYTPEYLPLFGDGDYGTGDDKLLVKEKLK